MKTYKRGSAAYFRQKETQYHQREAAKRPVTPRDENGQKYLHPERRRTGK